MFTTSFAQNTNECIADIDKRVSSFSQEVKFLYLECCHLSDDDMPFLLSYLDKHKEIKWLDLMGNNIKERGAKQLATNKSIENLLIGSNPIGSAAVIELAKNSTLKQLWLGSNSLTDEAVIALAHNITLESISLGRYGEDSFSNNSLVELTKNKNLKKLELDLDQIDKTDIIQSLSQNDTLKILGLRARNFTGEDAATVAKMPALKSFSLTCYGSCNIGDEGVMALSKNTNISRLSLYDIEISEVSASILGFATSLEYLSLWHNHLTVSAASLLSKNASLHELSIGYNDIGDEGAIAVSAMTSLRDLTLTKCNIHNEGAFSIAKNTSLTQLAIIGNDIGAEGASAVSVMTNLRNLILSDCNIHNEGAFALANSNLKLFLLDVRWNHIGKAGIDALKNNPNIQNLYTLEDDDENKNLKKLSSPEFGIKSFCARGNSAMCKYLFHDKK